MRTLVEHILAEYRETAWNAGNGDAWAVRRLDELDLKLIQLIGARA